MRYHIPSQQRKGKGFLREKCAVVWEGACLLVEENHLLKRQLEKIEWRRLNHLTWWWWWGRKREFRWWHGFRRLGAIEENRRAFGISIGIINIVITSWGSAWMRFALERFLEIKKKLENHFAHKKHTLNLVTKPPDFGGDEGELRSEEVEDEGCQPYLSCTYSVAWCLASDFSLRTSISSWCWRTS
jgi:hypothetical protein